MSNKFELTFGLIKPHVVQNPVALKGIQNAIIENNYLVIRSKLILINKSLAKHLYEEHTNKFFYNRLVTFMGSGPSQALILGNQNAISKWRTLLGPTKIFKAIYSHPDSLRGRFGLTDTRNALHGSDSLTSFQRECKIIFPDFNYDEFVNENNYRTFQNFEFFEDDFVHRIICKNNDKY